jgi:Spy/CpxP family protein refolding chaperone
MDFKRKNPFNNWVVIILVILNLALLATVWYPRLKPREKEIQRKPQNRYDDTKYRQDMEDREQRNKRLVGFLKRELNFTRDQVEKFMQLRDEHFQKASQIRRQVDDLRRELMEHLLDDQPDSSQVEELTEKMGQKTAELEKSVFYHFIELMEVCDSEQKSKYKSLLREILNQLKPPDHRSLPGDQPPLRDHSRKPAGGLQSLQHQGLRQDRREQPPRDDTGGNSHAERFFNRLRVQLKLTDSQVKKIQPLVESAHQELEKIPYDPQYSTHTERSQAMNRVNQWLDSQIEALLTEQQKKQYAEIKEERNRRLPLLRPINN